MFTVSSWAVSVMFGAHFILIGNCILMGGRLQAARAPAISAPAISEAPSTTLPLTPTPSAQLVVATLDQANNELPGATVAVTYRSPHGSRMFICTAGNRGIAAFRGIPSAAVEVLVKLAGFSDLLLPAIRLSSQETRVTASLKPSTDHGGITNAIPINASGAPLWSPAPEPTAIPFPLDIGIRCDPR